jgi:ABC-type branched-subunit amino acid transport system substrate-binding protein
MKIHYKVALFLLALSAHNTLAFSPALADRFYVALAIPLSGPAAQSGEQIRKGFMLATTLRDSHGDEESDGHLGNLDSYVRIIDANGDVPASLKRLLDLGEVNIVAAFTSDKIQSLITRLLEGKKIAQLLPGQTPFNNKDQPAVSAFISAYAQAYTTSPTTSAAQGFNAARRIDVAVRAQDGIRDFESLQQSFRQTARNFTW